MSDTKEAATAAKKPVTPSKPSFFKGVKTEFRKIFWPNRETVIKHSTAVVIVSVIVGAIIAVIDRAVLYGINFLIK